VQEEPIYKEKKLKQRLKKQELPSGSVTDAKNVLVELADRT